MLGPGGSIACCRCVYRVSRLGLLLRHGHVQRPVLMPAEEDVHRNACGQSIGGEYGVAHVRNLDERVSEGLDAHWHPKAERAVLLLASDEVLAKEVAHDDAKLEMPGGERAKDCVQKVVVHAKGEVRDELKRVAHKRKGDDRIHPRVNHVLPLAGYAAGDELEPLLDEGCGKEHVD